MRRNDAVERETYRMEKYGMEAGEITDESCVCLCGCAVL